MGGRGCVCASSGGSSADRSSWQPRAPAPPPRVRFKGRLTMPLTFARYLLVTFFARFALALAALGLVLTVFDTLAHIHAVLEGGAPVGLGLIAYASLRLPTLVVLLVPLAVLIGALLTLIALVASQELVVARAAGVSGTQITGIILIGAALVAGAHFLFANLVAVETAGRLATWQTRGYAGLPPGARSEEQGLWLAADSAIVHIGLASADGQRLHDVVLIQRDPAGGLEAFLKAQKARFVDGRWRLDGVERLVAARDSGPAPETPTPAFRWDPSRFGSFGQGPEELSFVETWSLRKGAGYSERTPRYYRFWTHRKLAQPASCLVMALLPAPMACQHARRRQLVLLGLVTLAAGGLYFGLERLLIPLGETAVLPPAFAAWAPAVVFAALAFWSLIMAES
ncbi:hypothetical protein CKO28_20250 [Rhodovibrio sodomensis]|uniref:LPS export ABC transporter permease LptG n=2 Tax=Rhodovibrio sodomensis TaxID=1088 RepID=A0ABS1DIQ7_9PROT|nr:hypothetical protein [Rhodovibrio sodomensis]